MTKIVEVLDKIKSDKRLKNQIIRACLIFVVAVVVVVGLVLTSEEEEQQPVTQQQEEKIDLIPAETTEMEDKSTVFQRMQWEDLKKDEQLEVVNTEGTTGFNFGEDVSNETNTSVIPKTTAEVSNTSIDSYIAQRRRAREQQQQQSENYATTRSYNPYGNTNDWEERKTETQTQPSNQASLTEGYTSVRQQQAQQQIQQQSFAGGKKKDDFESLSEAEKRRIILTTGQAQYRESEQISAMVLSSGEIKSGETITLTLKEDAILSFEKIPKGTTIAGKVSFTDNRLNVQFSTMRLKNKIIRVDLVLFGLDGLEGLPVSSNVMIREVEDAGIDEAIAETGTTVGKVGSIAGRLLKSNRRKEDMKIDLGRDIMCILVNRKIVNGY